MTLLISIYGLIIGSFLNVCIYRIPREESIAFPGSHCPKCSHNLKWYDNIPLFSWITLGGKCRYCKAPISIQYPLIESLNAFFYILFYFVFDFNIDFVFYSLLASVLIVITIIDLKEMIIPDVLVLIILILSAIYKTINYFIGFSPEVFSSLLGLLLAGGLFLAIVLLSRGGMGGGDVTLIGALGFVLGWKMIIVNILLSFVIGAIISVALLASGLKTRKDPIPFGPFIILAFFITVLWGQAIMDWYVGLLI